MRKSSFTPYLTGALLALLFAGPALSQEGGNAVGDASEGASATAADPTSVRLKEVVVTATKRSENIQNVAAAVTALSGESLSSAGITDALKLGREVPSLEMSDKGGVDGLVFLRGVGQSVGTNNVQDGVAVNLDNVFLPREIGVPELFDVNRVEVLPGPQGTLYGGSAAGGVINFVSARPTDQFGLGGSIEGGNYALFHLMSDINIPVTQGFAVRGAVNYDRHDGYLSDGLDAEDTVNGRVSALVRPSDDLSIFGVVEIDNRGGIGPGEILKGPGVVSRYQSPSDPWSDTFPTKGLYLDSRSQIALFQVNYHFAGNLNLLYIPSAIHSKTGETTQFQFLYGTPGLDTMAAGFPEDVSQYSQELRLSNDTGERNEWIGGLYWSTSTHDFGLLGPEPNPFVTSFTNNNLHNYAAYGQDTYSVLPQWRLTAGTRLSSDTFNGGGNVAEFGKTLYTFGGHVTTAHVDWKVGTEVDLSARSMAYVTVQTGYVQGGFTQTPKTAAVSGILEPEKLLSYTGGVKNRLLDDRLQINDELFYYDYKDYQLQLLEGLVNAAVGVPKSVIYGDQLDVRYRFTSHDEFGLNAEYTSARIKDPPPTSPSLRNYQLPDAPFLTVSASLEHDFELPNDSTVTARVQTYYNSGYWGVYTHDLYSNQSKFTKTDVTVTYYPADSFWNFGFFVRNIENAAVYNGCSGATKPGDPIGCIIEPPRTFGVRLEMRMK